MKKKSAIKVIFYMVFVLGSCLFALQFLTGDTFPIATRLKIEGYVDISMSDEGPSSILMSVCVHQLAANGGEVAMPDLQVALMDWPVKGDYTGCYTSDRFPCKPSPGMPIIVTFKSKTPLWPEDLLGGGSTFRATATLGEILRINTPANNHHIRLHPADLKPLLISWSGGRPPYYVDIWYSTEIKRRQQNFVFSKITSSTSVSVPLNTFLPGKSYMINVASGGEKLIFDPIKLRSQFIELSQTEFSRLYVD